jgi:hypothetical protein
MQEMLPTMSDTKGKLSRRDAATARALRLAPWAAIMVAALPAPIIFLILFVTAQATDAAAVYLLFAVLSLTLGIALGLVLALAIWLYRRRWLTNLRDRLASDGITANEVVWFKSELTSAERGALREIERSNPLLADAYLETLASRLTASRIVSRARREVLKVERRLNRARSLGASNSASLQEDLEADRERLEQLRQHASQHLLEAKTRLQVIEATASRKLNQTETDLMMERLGSAQDSLPLVLQIAQMEEQFLREEVSHEDDPSASSEHG